MPRAMQLPQREHTAEEQDRRPYQRDQRTDWLPWFKDAEKSDQHDGNA